MRSPKFMLAALLVAVMSITAHAQDQGDAGDGSDESEPQYTLFSFKLSGGYGLGRSRQIVGFSGGDAVYYSAGQGVKMDLALDLPLLPISVINSDGEEYGPEKVPYVGLEAELASGYHIANGGTTSDANGTVKRSYTYIPITLGLNARASFGPGLPSVYIGAGGGIHLKAIYEDNVTNGTLTSVRTYDPPLPFELYGVMGLEIPLMYSADDGNSMLDLFGQLRLTEATNYIYEYTNNASNGTSTVVKLGGEARSASNLAFNLGIRINLY
ncbi:MAG: hypothetical protein JSS75_14160 [Bacteroidetes bacterium]|nr:hypothetical protein [Bacteroidota bacterium]